MSLAMTDYGRLLIEFERKIRSLVTSLNSGEQCGGCMNRYADLACALFLDEIKKIDPEKEFVDSAFKTMLRMLMGFGIAAFPLSLKSYKELCWSKGWNESHLFE